MTGRRGTYKMRDPLERFVEKLDPDLDDCWLWVGALNNKGYPVFSVRAVKVYAHRWLYERVVEPIGDGLELDHLCHVPACVNPDHLEPVTHAVNMQRTRQALSTHCRNGHEWTEENTWLRLDNGRRQCRACNRARWHRNKPDHLRQKESA